MKISKKEFTEQAYIYDIDHVDGAETWECVAHGLVWGYAEKICPNPCDNLNKYLDFTFDEEFEDIISTIVSNLKVAYDNNEDRMLEDFE
jgi:hypothetical protein